MRILFLGDIVGRPGRSVLENNLRRIQDEEKIDFTIANPSPDPSVLRELSPRLNRSVNSTISNPNS